MAPTEETCILEFAHKIKVLEEKSYLGTKKEYIDLKQFEVASYAAVKKMLELTPQDYDKISPHQNLIRRIGEKIEEKFKQLFPMADSPVFGKTNNSYITYYPRPTDKHSPDSAREPFVTFWRTGKIEVEVAGRVAAQTINYSKLKIVTISSPNCMHRRLFNDDIDINIIEIGNNHILTVKIDKFGGAWFISSQ